MPPSKLYIVGTMHIDLKGPKRLRKLLHEINPDHISVEIDPITQERVIADPRLKEFYTTFRYPDHDTIKAILKVAGYELGVSRQFSDVNPAIVHFTDDIPSDIDLVDLIIRMNHALASFSAFTIEGFNEAVVQRAYDLRSPYDNLEELMSFEVISKRDIAAEEAIRNLDGRVVHVGGLAHSFGNYHNLYDRLKDLNPRRIKLCDVDDL